MKTDFHSINVFTIENAELKKVERYCEISINLLWKTANNNTNDNQ